MNEVRQTEVYAIGSPACATARPALALTCASAVYPWAMLAMCARWAAVSLNCVLIMGLAIGSTSFSEGQHW